MRPGFPNTLARAITPSRPGSSETWSSRPSTTTCWRCASCSRAAGRPSLGCRCGSRHCARSPTSAPRSRRSSIARSGSSASCGAASPHQAPARVTAAETAARLEDLARAILKDAAAGHLGSDLRATADEILLADGLAVGEGSGEQLGGTDRMGPGADRGRTRVDRGARPGDRARAAEPELVEELNEILERDRARPANHARTEPEPEEGGDQRGRGSSAARSSPRRPAWRSSPIRPWHHPRRPPRALGPPGAGVDPSRPGRRARAHHERAPDSSPSRDDGMERARDRLRPHRRAQAQHPKLPSDHPRKSRSGHRAELGGSGLSGYTT